MKPIWIVDDDESIRWVLEKALARENLATRSFSNAREAMEALKTSTPQVLVSDIRMPGESGLVLLQAVKAQHPGLPVIIITAFSDLDSAVASFQGGAFEYLAKPFDVDKAVELIRRALAESLREASVEQAQTEAPEILGQAPAMQDVFRAIGRLSQSNVTVLITGESGTGKELVARALHKHSPRASQPFIALNTAAIPKDLLESELFGHERGAFTGAQATRRGRFEQAEGGTLFLDEIGDMPFDLQTRLLRVLSDGHFYRVGGHQPLKANVRVIAATHQNLEQRVRDGLFREDLYHRLNVIRLRLPSLRERREDIPLLIRHFLAQSARQLGAEVKRMSDHAMVFLSSLDLPGNVRQLENLCNWITVMAPGQTVEVKDLPQDLTDGGGFAHPATAAAPAQGAVRGSAHGPTSASVQEIAEATANGPGAMASGGMPVMDHHAGMNGSGEAAGNVQAGHAAHAGPAGPAGHVPLSPTGLPGRSGFPGAFDAAPSGNTALAGALPSALPPSGTPVNKPSWIALLETEAAQMLAAGRPEVMDALGRVFESTLIKTALRHTHGRKNDAAVRLGIGRNTITRKIQELGIDGAKED